MKVKEKTPASKLSYAQKIKSISLNRERGDSRVIAKQLGYHESTVSSVLKGSHRNDSIVNTFYNMIRTRKSSR